MKDELPFLNLENFQYTLFQNIFLKHKIHFHILEYPFLFFSLNFLAYKHQIFPQERISYVKTFIFLVCQYLQISKAKIAQQTNSWCLFVIVDA